MSISFRVNIRQTVKAYKLCIIGIMGDICFLFSVIFKSYKIRQNLCITIQSVYLNAYILQNTLLTRIFYCIGVHMCEKGVHVNVITFNLNSMFQSCKVLIHH